MRACRQGWQRRGSSGGLGAPFRVMRNCLLGGRNERAFFGSPPSQLQVGQLWTCQGVATVRRWVKPLKRRQGRHCKHG